MKRSKSIRLVLLGSVGALALTACDGSEQSAGGQFYQDQVQCAKDNNPDACRQALADAREAHQTTAPAFTTQASCEATFGAGNCGPAEVKPTPDQVAKGEGPAAAAQTQTQSVGSGGGFFMPLMLGYMMGNMFGGGGRGQPVWRDSRNTAYVGGRPAGTIDPASMARARATGTPVQVARGGFGTSAAGYSSGS
jgi:uncharacterized protein YgiB involved in biofilm formation